MRERRRGVRGGRSEGRGNSTKMIHHCYVYGLVECIHACIFEVSLVIFPFFPEYKESLGGKAVDFYYITTHMISIWNALF